VVEFAAALAPEMKLKGLAEKHILRVAMKDMLPPQIGSRPKQPYRAPDSRAFTGKGALDYVAKALGAERLEATGLFDPKATMALHAKCASGRAAGFRDNAAFVGILSTQLWMETFAAANTATARAA
jgi:asparagine synthase (glutamine-hydrolysing)